MKFRHELKHEINMSDMLVLRQRLRAVMRTDENAPDGKYQIRSLYFDNLYDKALMEKINGISCREKFRIRYYNHNPSVMHLEKKSKINGLCSKQSDDITVSEVEQILGGNIDWMMESDRKVIQELHCKMVLQGMKPKTIVDYTREAFTFPAGNVRVTLDYDIRTGINGVDFLNPSCMTVPIRKDVIILEVKWDNLLPDVIRDAVQLGNRHGTAYSKYAACRIYG